MFEDFGPLIARRPAVKCPNGGSAWGGTSQQKRAQIQQGVNLIQPVWGALSRRTIAGFSQGAYAAAEQIVNNPGDWDRVILIGASVELCAQSLRVAGVQKVLLAAGDFDQANGNMQATAKRLIADGMPTKFVSLGPVDHRIPLDTSARLKWALV